MKVAVLGSGIAGAAACFRLARASLDVTWIGASRGATLLTSGALDIDAYQGDARQAAPVPLSESAMSFCETLGLHRVRAATAAVVTGRGTLRYPRAADVCVLNLNELSPAGPIALLQIPLWGWDASWMARSLNECASAFSGRFVAPAWNGPTAPVPFRSSYDCAEWIASRRTEIVGFLRREADTRGIVAWLLPAACFSSVADWQIFAAALGMPIGETLSGLDGLAGSRYEAAREALVNRLALRTRVATLSALALESDGGIRVSCKEPCAGKPPGGESAASRVVADAAQIESIRFDAAVLALGGINGGGLSLDRVNQFRLGVAVTPHSALSVTLNGRPFSVSAEQGLDVSAIGIEKLTQIGVSLAGMDAAWRGRLAVAGDFLADRPRTIGAAIESGILAAEMVLAD